MIPELRDFREHLIRYRAVTLQTLDLVTDEQLEWRPGPDHYMLGQLLLHIAQTEDFQVRGLLEGDWDYERVRFPSPMPDREGIRTFFEGVRDRTLQALEQVTEDELDRIVELEAEGQPEFTLRSWLWYVLEHEIHHKGQIWVYLRQMGITPPFFAAPLPEGERPDVEFREKLGGF